jgi:hypothetical protein
VRPSAGILAAKPNSNTCNVSIYSRPRRRREFGTCALGWRGPPLPPSRCPHWGQDKMASREAMRRRRAGSSSSSTIASSSCKWGRMLALSDEGLARLCIAATRIAPSGRGRWLQSIARELEGHPPSATARRVRKFRGRRRNGQACYRIVQDQVDLEELLLAAGTLSPLERDNHAAVERALTRFLAICIADHHGNAFPSGRGIFDRVRVGLCLSALRRKGSDGPPKRPRPSR